jgi:hypothetical protein
MQEIPDGDWFCDKCSVKVPEDDRDDKKTLPKVTGKRKGLGAKGSKYMQLSFCTIVKK